MGRVTNDRYDVFGKPPLVVFLFRDVGRVVRLLDAYSFNARRVRTQVMHLRVGDHRLRLAALCKGSRELSQIDLRITLKLKVVSLPAQKLETSSDGCLQLPDKCSQLVIGQPAFLRGSGTRSARGLDEQAHPVGISDGVALDDWHKSLVLQTSFLTSLLELLFDDDILGVFTQRCVGVQDERLRPGPSYTSQR